MAEEITLDTLMQGKENTALQKQEPVDVETVRAQVEELTPAQRARVEELKNSIDLMDSQTALQYGIGAQRNISSFSDNILAQVRSKGQRLCGGTDVGIGFEGQGCRRRPVGRRHFRQNPFSEERLPCNQKIYAAV